MVNNLWKIILLMFYKRFLIVYLFWFVGFMRVVRKMEKKINRRDFNCCMLSIYNNGTQRVYILDIKDCDSIYFNTFEGLDEYLRLHFKEIC